MDIKEPTLSLMLKGHMKYMSERQGVLAQNVANMDTPGYKARDLKKPDFDALLHPQGNRLPMVETSPAHSSGTLGRASAFRSDKVRDTFETEPQQNNVVMEDQMAKINDTTTQFQLSSTLLKKYTTLQREALGNK